MEENRSGVLLARRLFTVEEYYQMARAGILTEDDRVELIEGEIVRMSPIGSRHAACVGRLTQLLVQRLGDKAIVWVQNPVRLDKHSEPQPDIALLRPAPDFYARAHPGPKDVLLVIEVADVSREADRRVKLPLYARAGIREAWLVDLVADAIEVHREPTDRGYAKVSKVGRGEDLSPLAAPEVSLRADEILG